MLQLIMIGIFHQENLKPAFFFAYFFYVFFLNL